jgi:hypothetical protein
MSQAVPSDVEARIDGRMWNVTVTVCGASIPEAQIRASLERLAHEHPFLLACRYATDRAEVRYWDEARDVGEALDLASGLWDLHRLSAGLPEWEVVGIEVVDQETFHLRNQSIQSLAVQHRPGLMAAGQVLPF